MSQPAIEQIGQKKPPHQFDIIFSQMENYFKSKADFINDALLYKGNDTLKIPFEVSHMTPEKGNPYYSIKLLNHALFSVGIKKDCFSIKVSKKWFTDLSPLTYKFVCLDDIEFLLERALQVLIYELKYSTSSDEFQCCSRYKECSEAGGCINPCVDFALNCIYWANLRNGKNFYKS